MTDDSQSIDEEPSQRPGGSGGSTDLPVTVEDPDRSATMSTWMRPPVEPITTPPPLDWRSGPHEQVPWPRLDEFMITGPFGADSLEKSVKRSFGTKEPAPKVEPARDAGAGTG